MIAALGYSEREARFLARVASVGGYFVRRQFAEATGLARGRADLSFARRLVERRHATVQTFCRTEQVYHLSMRSMYEGLGEAPKSTRRSRPALAIKGRLMALDVVIARPDIELAVTESARLALCTRHGIDRARIPQRRYRPYRSAAPVTRFFPHAGLVGEIRSASREAGTVVFVYIDDGARSRSGFDTYLRHHAQLLAALPVWRVIYVAESARQATHAARIFARAFGELAGESREQMRADLGEYFRLRQLYDGGRWEALDTSRLERFFDLRNRFGASVEPLFAAWQLRGDDALSERSHEALRPSRDRFETLILPHSYAAVEGVRGLR